MVGMLQVTQFVHDDMHGTTRITTLFFRSDRLTVNSQPQLLRIPVHLLARVCGLAVQVTLNPLRTGHSSFDSFLHGLLQVVQCLVSESSLEL